MKTTKIDEKKLKGEFKEIYNDLEEQGHDASKQIIEYLVSGDPGYISSYKNCRNRILKLNRNTIMSYMIKEYIK